MKELWETLKTKIAGFFSEIQVFPSLLHGDLWSGNVGEIREGPGEHTHSHVDKPHSCTLGTHTHTHTHKHTSDLRPSFFLRPS